MRSTSMPAGYGQQAAYSDPRMRWGFQQGFGASPYSAVRGRRQAPYQQGLHGAQLQQYFAGQGMFQPVSGPGLNLASFLTKLAFSGGMR